MKIILTVVFFLSAVAFMAPHVFAVSPTPIGTVASTTVAGGSSSITLSFTEGTGGQNLAIIVKTGCRGTGDTPSSVTYNGIAMTQIVNLPAIAQTAGLVYYMATSTTGAHNIVATESVACGAWMIAETWQDIVQSSATVVDRFGGNSLTGTSISTTTTTLVDSDAVLTWAGISSGASGVTPNSPQIYLNADKALAPGMIDASSYVAKDPKGAITVGYSWTTSSSVDLFQVSLKYLAPTAAAPKADNSVILY